MKKDVSQQPKSGEKFATEQGFSAIKNGIKNSTKATADIERKRPGYEFDRAPVSVTKTLEKSLTTTN